MAVGNGITINGLPLMLRTVGRKYGLSLDDYYFDCVIGGQLSFSLPVASWDQFPDAVRRKLALELAGGDAPVWQASVLKGEGRGRISGTDCAIGEKLRWGMEPDG